MLAASLVPVAERVHDARVPLVESCGVRVRWIRSSA